MNSKVFLIAFLVGLIAFPACSDNDDEETKKEQSDDVEVEDVEQVAEDFFYSLLNFDFKTSKELVTKASYSSVSFLEKVSADFQPINFSQVKSCEVTGDQAVCICEFNYFGGEKVEQKVLLGKYKDDWLIDFQLGKTIENIFVYNYSYKLNPRWEDTEQLPLDSVAVNAMKLLLDRMLSKSIKLGFSSSTDVQLVDLAYEGNSVYGSSEYFVDDFSIISTYSFTNDRLESCYVDISSVTDGVDISQFTQSFCQLIVDRLGRPYNVPEEAEEDFYEVLELRWFIKGYNEVLSLTIVGEYFELTINEIP